MIDFNNPTVVTVSITSDVVDFQLPGKLGWQDNVKLAHLPPYETTREEVVDEIIALLTNVGLVPYDNLAVMEGLLAKVEKLKADATVKVTTALKKPDAVVFKYKEQDGEANMLTLNITIAQREDTPAVKEVLNSL